MAKVKVNREKLRQAIWEVLNVEDFPKEAVEDDIELIVARYLDLIE